MEKRRQPKKIKPPDRIGQKFRNGESPGLSVAEKLKPGYLLSNLSFCTTADVLELRASQRRMLGRVAILLEPPDDPRDAKKSGAHECFAPAIMYGDPRNGGRS